MNRWQKIAWFNMAVMIVMLLICSLVVVATGMLWRDAITPPSPLTFVILPAFVLVGISAKVIFRKKPQRIDFDERDKQIHRNSQYAGWIAFASSITAGVLVCYLIVGPKGDLYPLVLPLLVVIGVVIYSIVASIAALIQYGLKAKEGNHE